jgi:beta-lactamase regulating signal transducer with metallopeptidase domain
MIMDYLFKVTVAWTIFLLLFEIFYKNNSRFTANRVYLLLTIAFGLLLPIIPLPTYTPQGISAVQNLYTVTLSPSHETAIPLKQDLNPAVILADNSGNQDWNIAMIIAIIYGAGVLVLLVKYLFELYKITRIISRNPAQVLYGNKVITTGKIHSPYSFMGRIFLTSTAFADPKELEYIIRHEAAHHTRKHWLDLWISQIVCMVFWFHPLVWRYRYLLRLQHEYEADAIAAGKDRYNYGQFLLGQTLLKGVSAIAHSFHFSPIKNRIHMLTKKQRFSSGNWSYLLLIPVLMVCTFLMANSRVNDPLNGNQKVFRGNIFSWREDDSSFSDGQKEDVELMPGYKNGKPRVIISMNDERVYQNDSLQMKATYGDADTAFASYVIKEFRGLCKNTRDSLTYLVNINVIIDKGGKIVYYDANYDRIRRTSEQQMFWDPFYILDPQPNQFVEKIIDKAPLWKPAMIDGKPVNSFVRVALPGC